MSAEAEEPAKAPAPAEGAPAAAGGGMSPMVFFGAMGLSWVLMLGGGFALVQFVLPAKLADAMKQPAAATAEAGKEGHGEAKADAKKEEAKKEDKKAEGHGEAKAEGKKEEGGHGEAKKEEAPAKAKEFVLSEIVVNVAGSRGARYIKASVYFDASPEVLEELEKQRARIIDLVSTTLAAKTMDELTSPSARGMLREEMTATCNGLLKKGQIKNLYFVDFLIQ
ncbi:MAG: hypothetical protein B9S32_10325 [Verrucomicrobia bacterium Tous-C9LFEB]|nr:MAG: hypothetical protein B9S32_10325 [Verrucomicrobia bacterium Tous-C9LFEB]